MRATRAAVYAKVFNCLRKKKRARTMATMASSSMDGTKKRALRSGVSSVGSGAVYMERLYPGIFNIYTENMLWLASVPVALVAWDFCKAPMDKLYFQNPWRPLVGMRNTLVDLFYGKRDYYPFDLWEIGYNFGKIRKEFFQRAPTLKKEYFHDMDPWFSKNENYYYYKVRDFPFLQSIVDNIPSVDKETGVIAVIDGPLVIPPHRAESNLQLRYHMTLEGDGDCTLFTRRGRHVHKLGEEFMFDHALYHSVQKSGSGRRVTLILDVNRF